MFPVSTLEVCEHDTEHTKHNVEGRAPTGEHLDGEQTEYHSISSTQTQYQMDNHYLCENCDWFVS